MAWKPDIIRLWKFPKEMKEFTIDQQKNMIAFSGSHLPFAAAVAGFRQTRGTAAGKRILSTAAFPAGRFRSTRQFRIGHRCYKMAQLWARNWHFPPTGVSRKGSLAVSKLSSMLTKQHGRAKRHLKIRSSTSGALQRQCRYAEDC
ncbi:hypothetical protein ACLB1N_20105 [Escherichia coli]